MPTASSERSCAAFSVSLPGGAAMATTCPCSLSHRACSRTRNSMPPRWEPARVCKICMRVEKREGAPCWRPIRLEALERPWRRARAVRGAASGRVGGAGRGPGAMPVAWLRPAARAAARGRILGAFREMKRRAAAVMSSQARPVHWRCVARSASRGGRRIRTQHRPACQSGQIQPDAERCVRHQARSRATGDWASWTRRCPRPCRAAG